MEPWITYLMLKVRLWKAKRNRAKIEALAKKLGRTFALLILGACGSPAATNLIPNIDFPEPPEPTGPLSLSFSDCEGDYADNIVRWEEHPDTGLCSFPCLAGIAYEKPIQVICANVGGICKVNTGNNSFFCVPPGQPGRSWN